MLDPVVVGLHDQSLKNQLYRSFLKLIHAIILALCSFKHLSSFQSVYFLCMMFMY